MTNFAYDFQYLKSGLEVLERYLLSDEVYWRVDVSTPAGNPPYPQLTLGWILLYRCRMEDGYDMDTNQRMQLESAVRQLDSLREEWRSAWAQKAAREFESRLTLWKNFLEDYRDEKSEHANRYPYEVNRRVMLDLLRRETDDIDEAHLELLTALDGLLKGNWVPGDFVWDSKLASAFPKITFWYLYGHLKT